MADPRRNIRALSLAPPPRPEPTTTAAPALPTTPTKPRRAESATPLTQPSLENGRRAGSHAGPDTVEDAGNQALEPEATVDRERRSRRARTPDSPARRNKPTNLYLPRATRDRLAQARTDTGYATIDLILQAVHAQWHHVQPGLRADGSITTDSDLDLPPPRRAHRSVIDATTVQLRLAAAEHAGLTKLASTARLSISELVTVCVDQHWAC